MNIACTIKDDIDSRGTSTSEDSITEKTKSFRALGRGVPDRKKIMAKSRLRCLHPKGIANEAPCLRYISTTLVLSNVGSESMEPPKFLRAPRRWLGSRKLDSVLNDPSSHTHPKQT